MALLLGVGGLGADFRELTEEDLEARDKGVADPDRPLTALGVFLALVALRAGVFFFFLLDLVGVGDLEVALEDAGVESLDLEEVGVSLRSKVSRLYLGLGTDLFAREADEVVGVRSSSSESIKRCVLDRRLELVRPLMIFACDLQNASNLRQFHYLSDAGKHYLHDLGPME